MRVGLGEKQDRQRRGKARSMAWWFASCSLAVNPFSCWARLIASDRDESEPQPCLQMLGPVCCSEQLGAVHQSTSAFLLSMESSGGQT
jgi:hypothetical protein